MASRLRDVVKERFWRDVLDRFATRGLSVREFCRGERLTEASFYAWRRTIADRDTSPAPIRVRGRSKPRAFLPLVVGRGECPSATITIELAGGRLLRLPDMIPAERLADLIVALEARVAR